MATEDSCLTRTVASTLGWGPPKAILKSRISAQVVYLEAIPGGPGKGWVSETGQGRRPRQCALIGKEMQVQSLAQEDALEAGMAPHSSVLA